MILITNIEFEETPYNPHQLMHFKYQQGYINPEQCTKDLADGVLSELIHGQRFTRPDGTSVTIGMTKQVAEVVGIQYQAWADSEKTISRLIEEAAYTRKYISGIQAELTQATNALVKTHRKAVDADFLTRLKWLFTGVKL